MKDLTEEDFRDRTQAVLRAEKIFVGGRITKNLSVAFKIYQEVLAERERQLILNTIAWGRRGPTFVDFNYERPVCPDCKSKLYIRVIDIPQGPANVFGWKTQLICDKCLHEQYSTKSVQKALDELVPKRRINARIQKDTSQRD